MPKVSVIIPIYNAEKYLRECLDSVVNQTLIDIEIICVNDSSTDNSLRILEEYAQKDDRIILINQVNKGVAQTRNEAINISKGEFICFLDSDDFYPYTNILEEQYNNAILNDVLICGGEFSKFKNNISPICLIQKFNKDEQGYLFKKDGVKSYSDYQFDYGFHRFIYNRDFLIKNNIYFPLYTRFEDPVFFAKAMFYAKSFYAIAKPVYAYRQNQKVVNWSKKNIIDLLSGIIDNLTFASTNDLSQLFRYTSSRFISFYPCIVDYCEDADIKKLLTKIFKINHRLKICILKVYLKMFYKKVFSLKNEYSRTEKTKIVTIFGKEIRIRKHNAKG